MKQSKKARRASWRRAKSIACAEVEWFFTFAKGTVPAPGEADPAFRDAAAAIQGWLRAILTFHAGALALRFTPREWPDALVQEFGSWTGIVVRLECAAHPSIGATVDLERAAVLRIEEALATRGASYHELYELVEHANEHVEAALVAYVKVRGFGRSVLPARGKVQP
jgi:hypothetical protein